MALFSFRRFFLDGFEMVRFRVKKKSIRNLIALLKAHQIERIVTNLKMDV